MTGEENRPFSSCTVNAACHIEKNGVSVADIKLSQTGQKSAIPAYALPLKHTKNGQHSPDKRDAFLAPREKATPLQAFFPPGQALRTVLPTALARATNSPTARYSPARGA